MKFCNHKKKIMNTVLIQPILHLRIGVFHTRVSFNKMRKTFKPYNKNCDSFKIVIYGMLVYDTFEKVNIQF